MAGASWSLTREPHVRSWSSAAEEHWDAAARGTPAFARPSSARCSRRRPTTSELPWGRLLSTSSRTTTPLSGRRSPPARRRWSSRRRSCTSSGCNAWRLGR
eukprot:9466090-Pyramimonas_sp.AAC.1